MNVSTVSRVGAFSSFPLLVLLIVCSIWCHPVCGVTSSSIVSSLDSGSTSALPSPSSSTVALTTVSSLREHVTRPLTTSSNHPMIPDTSSLDTQSRVTINKTNGAETASNPTRRSSSIVGEKHLSSFPSLLLASIGSTNHNISFTSSVSPVSSSESILQHPMTDSIREPSHGQQMTTTTRESQSLTQGLLPHSPSLGKLKTGTKSNETETRAVTSVETPSFSSSSFPPNPFSQSSLTLTSSSFSSVTIPFPSPSLPPPSLASHSMQFPTAPSSILPSIPKKPNLTHTSLKSTPLSVPLASVTFPVPSTVSPGETVPHKLDGQEGQSPLDPHTPHHLEPGLSLPNVTGTEPPVSFQTQSPSAPKMELVDDGKKNGHHEIRARKGVHQFPTGSAGETSSTLDVAPIQSIHSSLSGLTIKKGATSSLSPETTESRVNDSRTQMSIKGRELDGQGPLPGRGWRRGGGGSSFQKESNLMKDRDINLDREGSRDNHHHHHHEQPDREQEEEVEQEVEAEMEQERDGLGGKRRRGGRRPDDGWRFTGSVLNGVMLPEVKEDEEENWGRNRDRFKHRLEEEEEAEMRVKSLLRTGKASSSPEGDSAEDFKRRKMMHGDGRQGNEGWIASSHSLKHIMGSSPLSGSGSGVTSHKHKKTQKEKEGEEYYHVLVALCFGFLLLVYVLIHIIVSVHDALKRKRYGAFLETRHLIGGGFSEDDLP